MVRTPRAQNEHEVVQCCSDLGCFLCLATFGATPVQKNNSIIKGSTHINTINGNSYPPETIGQHSAAAGWTILSDHAKQFVVFVMLPCKSMTSLNLFI